MRTYEKIPPGIQGGTSEVEQYGGARSRHGAHEDGCGTIVRSPGRQRTKMGHGSGQNCQGNWGFNGGGQELCPGNLAVSSWKITAASTNDNQNLSIDFSSFSGSLFPFSFLSLSLTFYRSQPSSPTIHSTIGARKSTPQLSIPSKSRPTRRPSSGRRHPSATESRTQIARRLESMSFSPLSYAPLFICARTGFAPCPHIAFGAFLLPSPFPHHQRSLIAVTTSRRFAINMLALLLPDQPIASNGLLTLGMAPPPLLRFIHPYTTAIHITFSYNLSAVGNLLFSSFDPASQWHQRREQTTSFIPTHHIGFVPSQHFQFMRTQFNANRGGVIIMSRCDVTAFDAVTAPRLCTTQTINSRLITLAPSSRYSGIIAVVLASVIASITPPSNRARMMPIIAVRKEPNPFS